MPTDQLGKVIQQLRAALALDATGLTDGQLLEAFVGERDEASFEALVRHHGPLVLGVCRRVLGNAPDAEDAFQATFLVLVRKAASLRSRELVGNWLYGVAYRIALDARGKLARQRAEKQVKDMPQPKAEPKADRHELQAVLDGVLSRLPDKYRLPVVLCELEGRTRKEVARQLGIPEGTLSSRLATARKMLAKRLPRHGVGLTGGALGTVPFRNGATASVPPPLAGSTVKAALLVAAGKAASTAAISTEVAALAEGVMKAMLLSKLKVAIAVLLAVGVIGAGAGMFAYSTRAAEQAEPKEEASPESGRAIPDKPKADAPRKDRAKDDRDNTRTHSVKNMPPVVLRTLPRAGDTEVDAAKTNEIRVTFSKDMMGNSWSWSQISDETFPEVTGKPRYDKDRRTCILPVKLEAGKTYVLWLNSNNFHNFKDAGGNAAIPYLLVFETKR